MEAYTTLPENTPARHLNMIICQSVLLNPNNAVAIAIPTKEKISTGFLPMRSAARPHVIIMHI
jgi:hypothetical protein